MEKQHTSLEIIAASVDEAVEKGLSELGLSAGDVDVEVLDSGTKGLFGLGSRLARVKLTVKSDDESEAVEMAEFRELYSETGHKPSEVPAYRPAAQSAAAGITQSSEAEVEIDDDELIQIALETVEDLLHRMKIHAKLDVHWGTPEDPKDRTPLVVDIHGDDLSILIGPKAEILNALQYIASLIISKEAGFSVPLTVDVEGYRARRSRQIRQLARRMAEQAVRTGRRQVLEPMPANERRLVHIELRENPEVSTESMGEEPRRKVTIIPKFG